jgi:hypothetical protein
MQIRNRLDSRGHRLRGLLIPEDDMADEIRCRKRRLRQAKKFMAGLDPARMAELAL